MVELSQSLVTLLWDQLDELYLSLQQYEDLLGEAENQLYEASNNKRRYTDLVAGTQAKIDEIEALTNG